MKKLILFGCFLIVANLAFSQKSTKLTVPKTVAELKTYINTAKPTIKAKIKTTNNNSLRKFNTVTELKAFIASSPKPEKLGSKKRIRPYSLTVPKTVSELKKQIK